MKSTARTDTKAIYDSFKDVMEKGVLPLRASHPEHIRLDGHSSGGNGSVAFRFRHQGKVWEMNFDTHYDRLLLAYAAVKNGDDDPFIEEPTRSKSRNCLVLKNGPTKPKFIFIYESRTKR